MKIILCWKCWYCFLEECVDVCLCECVLCYDGMCVCVVVGEGV